MVLTSIAATQIDPKGNDDTSFLYRQFSSLHSTTSPVFGEGERFDFGKVSSPLSWPQNTIFTLHIARTRFRGFLRHQPRTHHLPRQVPNAAE